MHTEVFLTSLPTVDTQASTASILQSRWSSLSFGSALWELSLWSMGRPLHQVAKPLHPRHPQVPHECLSALFQALQHCPIESVIRSRSTACARSLVYSFSSVSLALSLHYKRGIDITIVLHTRTLVDMLRFQLLIILSLLI